MIFNEVYGAYTRTMALLLNRALENHGLSAGDVRRIIEENAFGESYDYMREILNPSGESAFPLLYKDPSTRKYTTVLDKPPRRPVTLFELRWFKAVTLDPRIRLFTESLPSLDGIEPLFRQEDIIYYDRDRNGDDFTSPEYIAVFRALLTAIREKRIVEISRDNGRSFTAKPLKLEYSPKDDRFRAVTAARKGGGSWYVPLSDICSVRLTERTFEENEEQVQRAVSEVVLEVTDEKDAMERVSLGFSHLERTAERIGKSRYRLTVTYDTGDRAEMIIRIMSYGKYVRVMEPEDIRAEIERRLRQQMELLSV